MWTEGHADDNTIYRILHPTRITDVLFLHWLKDYS